MGCNTTCRHGSQFGKGVSRAQQRYACATFWKRISAIIPRKRNFTKHPLSLAYSRASSVRPCMTAGIQMPSPAVNCAFIHASPKRPMMGVMCSQGQMVDWKDVYMAAVFLAVRQIFDDFCTSAWLGVNSRRCCI